MTEATDLKWKHQSDWSLAYIVEIEGQFLMQDKTFSCYRGEFQWIDTFIFGGGTIWYGS